MPELPEVETVSRHLRPELVGATITGFDALWHKVTAPSPAASFGEKVLGRTITDVRRRAKFILLQLDVGLIHIHLRMTGRLFAGWADLPEPRHLRARFTLSGGRDLYFTDARKFGRIGYVPALAALEARLGPEPLEEAFTSGRLFKMLRGHNRQIKPLLLDQAFIAGLGNIYVDEALHAAGIHPLTSSGRVARAKAEKLHHAIRDILTAAIASRGTTIMNYVDGEGQPGGYAVELQVFGREGEACMTCGTTVVKTWVGQRGTHLCPRCQRRR